MALIVSGSVTILTPVMTFWKTSLALCAALIISADGQTAEQLMERARIAATLQNNDLRGNIRKGRAKTDVSLFLRGENIQFTTEDGAERFHMRLGDNKFDLLEIVG